MGMLPSPESYARTLVNRKSPAVPLAEQEFLRRIKGHMATARKPSVQRLFAMDQDRLRGRPNDLQFPWIERRRKKFGALVYVEGKRHGRRVTGPSRPTILEAARDAVEIRRAHKLPIPAVVLSKLDALEAEARKSSGSA